MLGTFELLTLTHNKLKFHMYTRTHTLWTSESLGMGSGK